KDMNGHIWRVLLLGEKILATSSPWGADFNQVILSQDKGATFQKIRQGLPPQRSVMNTVWQHGYARALAAHPDRPDTIYLGIDGDDYGGFFVSTDGGRSWTRPTQQPGSL